jgi:hypothetical protein
VVVLIREGPGAVRVGEDSEGPGRHPHHFGVLLIRCTGARLIIASVHAHLLPECAPAVERLTAE